MNDALIPRSEIMARWELAAEDARQALSKTLVVAFLGSASSGKDSAIRALFGIDFGQIDPIPGSTDRIRVAALDAERHTLVVNAPGFGDLRDEVEAEARRVLDQLDLAVYVVNCDGGATVDERRDLDAIRVLGRPVLVCLNKIDLIRPHQRDAFVASTLLQLGVHSDDAVVTAFDPLPALSASPIGVEAVVRWIYGRLAEQGKELLFAKTLRNRATACEVIIASAAKKAALGGAIPVPGADLAAVTAVQLGLISSIAAVYEKKLDKDLVSFMLAELLAGSSKGFVRWGINALKTAGWVPGGQIAHLATSALGAAIAGATTYGVGRASVALMQRDLQMEQAELTDVFNAAAFAWQTGQVIDTTATSE